MYVYIIIWQYATSPPVFYGIDPAKVIYKFLKNK